ncbi:MAG: N-6 DNA methylase [Xanthomonadales bacterium]|jgi:methylase of polypeptide subunit release factors|nr:N-6 DNA methylase [Xanthomonadales bacterium]
MSTEQGLADLQLLISQGRGNESASGVVNSWLRARVDRGEPITSDLLHAITAKRWGWFGDDLATPKALASFIGRLAALQSVQSVLDPTCGLGVLLNAVAVSTAAQIIHGVEINIECREIARSVVGDSATILLGDILKSPSGLQAHYDLIVANPPFGLRLRGGAMVPHLDENYRGDMGHALAVWTCAKLSAGGTAMMILSPTFLRSPDGRAAQSAISKCGCRIRALIHLPRGSFPHTSIDAYLAVLEHGTQQEVFIAQYSDVPQHQQSLIENYHQRRNGKQLTLGRLCTLSEFPGFEALARGERLKRMVRTKQWQRMAARLVIAKTESLRSSQGMIEQDSNSLFLRLAGQPTAFIDSSKISSTGMRECVRLSIDPTKADARYMVHWFNESPIGQLIVAGVRRSGPKPRIDLETLMNADLYLPAQTEQRQILQGIDHLNRIRAEATELECALWSSAEDSHKIVEQIKSINQQDHYNDWIESLPFPLASILWRHHAGGVSTRERFEVLLHFFEATAAFLATVHLSAFMLEDDVWRETAPELKKSLATQNLSLDRATFGAWRLTFEFLSKKCRKLLDDSNQKSAFGEVYGASSGRHLELICNPEIVAVLQRANKIRNETTGHGGAIGGDEAERIHDTLFELVQRIRGVFGRSWLDYELIQPSEGAYRGGIHHYKARRLMGTRSAPFEVVKRDSVQALEADQLYLFDASSQRGMKLRPFIRVMPSPEKKANACFIFSRSEKSGAHFVSYHFEEESSITAQIPEIDETFRRINIFDVMV